MFKTHIELLIASMWRVDEAGVSIYISTYIYMYSYIYAYVYKYMYTYTHIYIYTKEYLYLYLYPKQWTGPMPLRLSLLGRPWGFWPKPPSASCPPLRGPMGPPSWYMSQGRNSS